MTKLQLLEMSRLEGELLVERESLRKQFAVEKLNSVNEKSQRLEALKSEQKYEKGLYDKWREKFPALTDESFDTLWSTRLKDEAFIRDATAPDNSLTEARKHDVYSEL
jgi:hypothetical protein